MSETLVRFIPTVPEDEQQKTYEESHLTDKTLEAPHFTDQKPIVREDITLYPKGHAFILYNVLSPSECQYFIDNGERLKLEPVSVNGYRQDYRNNDRVIVKCKEISKIVYERTKSHFESVEVTSENRQNVGTGFNLEGVWEPTDFNDTWRICKYVPGGHFAPHYDGEYQRVPEERSMMTFMFYLNDGFTGGSTNFVDESQALYKDPQTNRYSAEEKNILRRVVPKQGMALVFRHHILHEGQALGDGVKYIMRSELMYRKVSGMGFKNEKEREAVMLLQEAQKLESDGKAMQAADLYKKAFKVYPPIESMYFS